LHAQSVIRLYATFTFVWLGIYSCIGGD